MSKTIGERYVEVCIAYSDALHEVDRLETVVRAAELELAQAKVVLERTRHELDELAVARLRARRGERG